MVVIYGKEHHRFHPSNVNRPWEGGRNWMTRNCTVAGLDGVTSPLLFPARWQSLRRLAPLP